MAYKIIWADLATEHFLDIVNYLEQEWSEKVAENFIEDCYGKLDLLKIIPNMGPASSSNAAIRRILITKRILLYYQKINDEIYLLGFFDTKQSPKKNPFE